jgi:flagella basal body P-ring formation protein FlgA
MVQRGKIIPFPARGAGARPPSDERALVELHRCDQAEAVVVKSLLESEGIPTLLRSRLAHSVHPFTVGAQGEAVVLVPESELARGRALLARLAPRSGTR